MLQHELETPSFDMHNQQLTLMQQTAGIMPAMSSRMGYNPYSINATVQPNVSLIIYFFTIQEIFLIHF